MNRKYLKSLRDRYEKRMDLIEVPLLPYEVRGVKRIAQVAAVLFPPNPG